MRLGKKAKLKSYDQIKKGSWLIKMSILNDYYILLVLVSEFTGQTIVRQFVDESNAAEFIDRISGFSGMEFVNLGEKE